MSLSCKHTGNGINESFLQSEFVIISLSCNQIRYSSAFPASRAGIHGLPCRPADQMGLFGNQCFLKSELGYEFLLKSELVIIRLSSNPSSYSSGCPAIRAGINQFFPQSELVFIKLSWNQRWYSSVLPEMIFGTVPSHHTFLQSQLALFSFSCNQS